jgi:hypothetical protein
MTSAKAIRYDVFERVGGEPAFGLVSDEEMQSGRLSPMIDDLGGELVELAHGVSAATAAELVGLNHVPKGVTGFTDHIAWLESHIAEYGSFAIGNFHEDWEVRLSDDGPSQDTR